MQKLRDCWLPQAVRRPCHRRIIAVCPALGSTNLLQVTVIEKVLGHLDSWVALCKGFYVNALQWGLRSLWGHFHNIFSNWTLEKSQRMKNPDLSIYLHAYVPKHPDNMCHLAMASASWCILQYLRQIHLHKQLRQHWCAGIPSRCGLHHNTATQKKQWAVLVGCSHSMGSVAGDSGSSTCKFMYGSSNPSCWAVPDF